MNTRLLALLLGLTFGLMIETMYVPWVRSRGDLLPNGLTRFLRLWLVVIVVVAAVMFVTSPPDEVEPLNSDLPSFVVFTLPLLVVLNLLRLVGAWRRRHLAQRSQSVTDSTPWPTEE